MRKAAFLSFLKASPRNLISDRLWRALQARLRPAFRAAGRQGRDNRRFLDAVFWVLRTGAPWRDLPSFFGRWGSVYRRFRRWAVRGRWRVLAPWTAEKRLLGRAEGFAVGFLDSTYVRVHQHGAAARRNQLAEGQRPSRGGKTSKVHLLVCSVGGRFVPRGFLLTAGNVADVSTASAVVQSCLRRPRILLADKAYDADALRSWLESQGNHAAVPARRSRRGRRYCPKKLYARRNLVERCFARLKQWRRFATRFARTDACWRSFCLLALAHLNTRAHGLVMAFRSATLVLAPKPQPEQLLWRHAGARRFAYNACVANVLAKLADKDQDPRPKLVCDLRDRQLSYGRHQVHGRS